MLEVLREPLESSSITISRAARQAEFPAQFQLVAAMNPCPCGHHGDASARCRCTEERIRQYRAKISGPLLEQAMQRLRLSARAYHHILKVARTIADLAGEENISPAHLAEAIQYRSLDRPGV